MAQYVNQYVTEMVKREMAMKDNPAYGVDVTGISHEQYMVSVVMRDVLIGVLMKRISTLSNVLATALPALASQLLVSDATWMADLDAALDQGGSAATRWPAWLLEQRDPNAPPKE